MIHATISSLDTSETTEFNSHVMQAVDHFHFTRTLVPSVKDPQSPVTIVVVGRTRNNKLLFFPESKSSLMWHGSNLLEVYFPLLGCI